MASSGMAGAPSFSRSLEASLEEGIVALGAGDSRRLAETPAEFLRDLAHTHDC